MMFGSRQMGQGLPHILSPLYDKTIILIYTNWMDWKKKFKTDVYLQYRSFLSFEEGRPPYGSSYS